MSQILTHRFSNKVYEWKVSPHGHYWIRQIYRDCSGVKTSKWQRVLSATVKQLVNESVEYGRGAVKHEPLIDVAKLGQVKQKSSRWFDIGLVLIGIGCLVAILVKLVERGVI